jgi:hypothetical protein
MFGNPVRLLTGLNPDFFEGTVVAAEVKALLASQSGPTVGAALAAIRNRG